VFDVCFQKPGGPVFWNCHLSRLRERSASQRRVRVSVSEELRANESGENAKAPSPAAETATSPPKGGEVTIRFVVSLSNLVFELRAQKNSVRLSDYLRYLLNASIVFAAAVSESGIGSDSADA
jgi:hypothetical protein